jgi:hypothetical protein
MHFFTHSPLGPGEPQLIGTNSSMSGLTGIAADSGYIYVSGEDWTAGQGIFRLDRKNLSAPVVRLAKISYPSGVHTSVVIDHTIKAGHL